MRYTLAVVVTLTAAVASQGQPQRPVVPLLPVPAEGKVYSRSEIATLLRRMAAANRETIKFSLGEEDPAFRYAAAVVVGNKLLPYEDNLIPLLADEDGFVRQAARKSLIKLAEAATHGKVPRSEYDFGPLPGASAQAQQEAVRLWSKWWEEWHSWEQKD